MPSVNAHPVTPSATLQRTGDLSKHLKEQRQVLELMVVGVENGMVDPLLPPGCTHARALGNPAKTPNAQWS